MRNQEVSMQWPGLMVRPMQVSTNSPLGPTDSSSALNSGCMNCVRSFSIDSSICLLMLGSSMTSSRREPTLMRIITMNGHCGGCEHTFGLSDYCQGQCALFQHHEPGRALQQHGTQFSRQSVPGTVQVVASFAGQQYNRKRPLSWQLTHLCVWQRLNGLLLCGMLWVIVVW